MTRPNTTALASRLLVGITSVHRRRIHSASTPPASALRHRKISSTSRPRAGRSVCVLVPLCGSEAAKALRTTEGKEKAPALPYLARGRVQGPRVRKTRIRAALKSRPGDKLGGTSVRMTRIHLASIRLIPALISREIRSIAQQVCVLVPSCGSEATKVPTKRAQTRIHHASICPAPVLSRRPRGMPWDCPVTRGAVMGTK